MSNQFTRLLSDIVLSDGDESLTVAETAEALRAEAAVSAATPNRHRIDVKHGSSGLGVVALISFLVLMAVISVTTVGAVLLSVLMVVSGQAKSVDEAMTMLMPSPMTALLILGLGLVLALIVLGYMHVRRGMMHGSLLPVSIQRRGRD